MAKTKATHYRCVGAETQFYTTGKVYELVEDDMKQKGFIADDGMFDLKSMVTSKFQPLSETEVKRLKQFVNDDEVATIKI